MRSLGEVIERTYSIPHLAQHVAYHANHTNASSNVCDFQDGLVYKKLRELDPRFAADAHNLMMALITDGVQPRKDDAKYSICSLAVTFYNFPPWLRCVGSWMQPGHLRWGSCVLVWRVLLLCGTIQNHG
jgi:hypothetical protein